MDPITISAGVAAVSSLVQLYNSEKARGAEKKSLNDIEAMYNKIKPPDYDLSIQDPPQLHEETLQQPQFSSSIAAPQYNLDKLTPQEFKKIGNYSPEVASYIAEAAPKLLTQSEDMKYGREAQKKALDRFMSIGEGEFDPELAQQQAMASRQAQGDAQSRQNSILQDFARRGQAGSGLALAAQMGGASQAMDRNAMAQMQAASDAYKNRLSALSQGANLGGQISNQDMTMQQQNADIINQFNQRMAMGRQNWENQRASALNNAQQYNLGVGQNVADMNTQTANQAMIGDRNRLDDITGRNYKAALDQQGRQDDLAKYHYDNQVAERNYGNQVATTKANWAASQQDRQNELRSQMYGDQLDKAKIGAGIAGQRSQANISATQDRNAAIQGLANAGMVYGQGRVDRNSAIGDQLAKDDRSQYEKTGSWMDDAARKKRQGYYSEYY